MGCSKSGTKREVYSNTGLPQETRKVSNNSLPLHLKELKRRTKPIVSEKKKKKW